VAKFSQTFLQGLLQPSYQQGLFEAARGVGMTPGIMRMQREEKAEQAQVQQLLQSNINNPAELTRLEQQYRLQGKTDIADMFAKAAVTSKVNVKQQGRESISVIQQQLMQETDPARMKELEDAMVAVARQTGQEDPSALIGRAVKLRDERTARQIKLEAQREKAIADAYYAVPEENKEQFVENAKTAGFSDVVQKLETDRMLHEDYLLKREQRIKDAKAPLNIPSIQKRIDALPKNQQAQFQEQLDQINESQPNFEEGGTWNTGERERAWRQLDSLDRALSSANATMIATTNSRIKTLNSRLVSIDKELNKPASNQQAKQFIVQAIEEVSSARMTDFIRPDVKATNPKVIERALELATAAKNEALAKEKESIQTELTELEKTFEPLEKTTETSTEDPLGIRV